MPCSIAEIRPNALQSTASASLLGGICRRVFLAKLASLEDGRLTIVDGKEEWTRGGSAASGDLPPVTLTVHDPAFYAEAVLGGTIGAAESYIRGHWTSDNLTALIRLFVRNRHLMESLEGGLGAMISPARRLQHALHRNSRRGSRHNIAAHYDLSNDFFALFLDPTMMYSSALYERPDMTLDEAAVAKVDRLCRKLDLKPTDHLLEIGTGWGGFAIHAARHYGCRVTTTTISTRQAELARRRIADAGLSHLITLLEQDYRDLEGQYDKLVSIEMIEAVGHQYYDTYFQTCSRLVKPDGLMALQAITIDDRLYDDAIRSVDFIQRYVFPGSNIPSIAAIAGSMRRASDFRLVHLEDIGPHYARTLRDWRLRFHARILDVRGQGFDDRFIRLWEFYLAYCEGGFLERSIGTVQVLLAKPANRRAPVLGEL